MRRWASWWRGSSAGPVPGVRLRRGDGGRRLERLLVGLLLGYFGIHMPIQCATPGSVCIRSLQPLLRDTGRQFVRPEWTSSPCARSIVVTAVLVVGSGIGEFQQRRGDVEAVRGALLHRHRHGVCLCASGAHDGELASIYSEEPWAFRAIRMVGHYARGERGLLCVHRLRCRFDGGPGGEESADAICPSAFSARW